MDEKSDRAGRLENGKLKISDLYFAATLSALDFELLGIERDPQRAWFVFKVDPEDEAELQQVTEAYDLDTLRVLVGTYVEKVKRLKAAVMRGRT